MFKRFLITALSVICISIQINAVPVNINSGNPTMPFPQFIDYNNGAVKSLASQQPDGVTHAEMEQWIRDAWQIHANEFTAAGTITYGGQTVNLIKDGSTPYCSEGHGYALLGAAVMADKTVFDGLWFYLNENDYFNKTKKYSTGAVVNPGYKYGSHAPAVYGAGSDSAADGDVDIAMAALIAWKQWGDDTGYYAPGGTGAAGPGGYMIQYKQMALDMLRFLVEKDEGDNVGDDQWTSGIIGFDGYPRGGNTGGGFAGETTNWGSTAGFALYGARPQFAGPSTNYFDYWGSAYFNAFACALQELGDPRDNNPGTGGWSNVNQFKRAAAADAWLVRQFSLTQTFMHAGTYAVNEAAGTATFGNVNMAEDMRAPFRKSLDYLWFGNPTTTWNPATHQPVAGGNTWQRDEAVRFSNFLKNNVACKVYGTSPVTYNGTAGALNYYTIAGAGATTFHLNWIFGAGASAVLAAANVSGDFTQAGEFFRELMILWDGTPGYLTSVPVYFHGFFRQMGLLTLTGNWINPCGWTPKANLKIYKSINKTYSFPTDTITYIMSVRNYGSVDGTNVIIRDTLPVIFNYISSTPAGTQVGTSGGAPIYEWNLGTVSGLHNQNYAATVKSVTLVVQVKDNALTGRYCNTADVRVSNGTGWRSSEFPNNITDVMERNCLDIVAAALAITKTASSYMANVGNTITYTIDYCNSSNAGWINGGRSGVNFSFGLDELPGASSPVLTFYLRANHAAAEPVINWKNYRLSYFLNSSYHGSAWTVALDYVDGFPNGSQQVSFEDIVPGSDAYGYWNQRIMLQFGNAQTVPTHHLFNYAGVPGMVHQGNTYMPFIIKGRIHASYNAQDWTDDWSQGKPADLATQNDPLWPITNDWTKGDGTSVPVTKINKHACQVMSNSIDNILIEEWDGYTWRRVFGNGPMPGRYVENVVIIDSLPNELNFGGFIGNTLATYTAATRTIQLNAGTMQVNQCGQLKYWVTVKDPGLTPPWTIYADNIAFIDADKEAPVMSAKRITITSATLPTPTPLPVSLTKTANQSTYNTGNTITYVIDYTNNYGTIANANFVSGEWTLRAGVSPMTFASSRINSVSNVNNVMTYNYSHGTNGTIEARLNLQSYAVFGISFRHNGTTGMGNGCYITLKPNPPVNGELRFWNGTTQVGATQSVFIPLNCDIKIVLNGGTVSVYLKDTSVANYDAFPIASIGGMTVQAGWAGVINGTPGNVDTYGTHYCNSFVTSLDTSFNTAITDPVPVGVSYLSGGTYAGA